MTNNNTMTQQNDKEREEKLQEYIDERHRFLLKLVVEAQRNMSPMVADAYRERLDELDKLKEFIWDIETNHVTD